MSKRNRKNLITLLSLLLILSLFITFYIWNKNRDNTLDKPKEQELEEETDDNLLLSSLDKELINRIHIANEYMEITLIVEDATWKDEVDPFRPIKQDYVLDMINILEEVRAIRLVNEDPTDLAEYGLDDPLIKVQVEEADGKSLILQIGQSAITSEGYYSLVNDHDSVYLLENSFAWAFNLSVEDIMAVAEGPEFDPQRIYYIEVLERDGEDFELLYEEGLDDSGADMFPWKVLKPFDEGYAADGAKVGEILPIFGDFDFIATVEYDSQNLSKYGLEEPAASIHVGYYKYYVETLDKPQVNPETGEDMMEKTYYEQLDYKIHVGNKDEEGNYYVRQDYSNAVYTMEASKVDAMLEVEIIDVLNSFILIPNIKYVDRIDIEIQGVPYTMEIKRTSRVNEDGEEEEVVTYYYQEEEVDEGVFKDVYQVMIAAGYDGRIREEVDIQEGQAFMTLTYHTSRPDGRKESDTSSYYNYNDSLYIVSSDGNTRFFADKRKIDRVAETIIEFKGDEE